MYRFVFRLNFILLIYIILLILYSHDCCSFPVSFEIRIFEVLKPYFLSQESRLHFHVNFRISLSILQRNHLGF